MTDDKRVLCSIMFNQCPLFYRMGGGVGEEIDSRTHIKYMRLIINLFVILNTLKAKIALTWLKGKRFEVGCKRLVVFRV